MVKRLQTYHRNGITVTFDPQLCIHSGVCICDLPEVFDMSRARWIRPENASTADVARVVASCPSAALKYVLDELKTTEAENRG